MIVLLCFPLCPPPCRHVFWDADVWMLPAMLPLRPSIARAMIHYRERTMDGALANAKAQGRNGTKWVWESAFSGVTAHLQAGQFSAAGEIHLQAGIMMACRQYYRLTHDKDWLRTSAWPMIQHFVEYFESRATRDPSSGALALDNVESPNEYASGIDNDIYTNAAFASVLNWIAVAAAELGHPPAECERYSELGAAIVIPFNSSLGRHMEYTDAPEALRIKQATMAMLPFPVMWDMDPDVQRRDLEYEAAHIGGEGPAMTHSMLAIDWLSIGNTTGGAIEFERSYNTNVLGPFLQWMECPIPPDFCQNHRPATNFLTGAGGFMQAVLYGYGGLRYNDQSTTMHPRIPSPSGGSSSGEATGMTMAFKGLHYLGRVLDVVRDANATRVTIRAAAGSPGSPATEVPIGSDALCLIADGKSYQLVAGSATSVAPGEFAVSTCVPVPLD